MLEAEVTGYLNDKDVLEYSLLLTLTKIHFPWLVLKEWLLLYQAICSCALNLGALAMAQLANFFERTIENEKFGRLICMDLRRGLSRQLVVFKLILLLHQFINEAEAPDDYEALAKAAPMKLIAILLKSLGVQMGQDFGEFDTYLKSSHGPIWICPKYICLTVSWRMAL